MNLIQKSRQLLAAAQFDSAYEAESEASDVEQLLAGIHFLEPVLKKASHPLAVEGAPLDAWLLSVSPSYRLSRAAFLDMGGSFRAELATARRILSSGALTDDQLAYSPIEAELRWTCDPESALTLEARKARLTALRDYPVNLFHEQNHRLAWRLLQRTLDLSIGRGRSPAAGSGPDVKWRRIFNFAEALIVTADVWIETELGQTLSRVPFLAGALFGPGNDWATTLGQPRGPSLAATTARRTPFHALAYATYLLLEGYETDDIAKLCAKLFGPLAEPALHRAFDLSPTFIEHTNPDWQALRGVDAARTLHARQVQMLRRSPKIRRPHAKSSKPSKPSKSARAESTLAMLPEDVRDNGVFFDIADTWISFWE